jgi:hypothetical protein
VTFEIYQNRSVAMASPPRPVIYSKHSYAANRAGSLLLGLILLGGHGSAQCQQDRIEMIVRIGFEHNFGPRAQQGRCDTPFVVMGYKSSTSLSSLSQRDRILRVHGQPSNVRRGIRRVCIIFAFVWLPLALLYPFRVREQFRNSLNANLDIFEQACVEDATGLIAAADGTQAAELVAKNCETAKDRLNKDGLAPNINTYRWFLRRQTAKIGLVLDRSALQQRYLLRYLRDDTREPLHDQYMPPRIALMAGLLTAPILLYYFLLCIYSLTAWVVRGFADSPA